MVVLLQKSQALHHVFPMSSSSKTIVAPTRCPAMRPVPLKNQLQPLYLLVRFAFKHGPGSHMCVRPLSKILREYHNGCRPVRSFETSFPAVDVFPLFVGLRNVLDGMAVSLSKEKRTDL
jgi:hypothetical protein